MSTVATLQLAARAAVHSYRLRALCMLWCTIWLEPYIAGGFEWNCRSGMAKVLKFCKFNVNLRAHVLTLMHSGAPLTAPRKVIMRAAGRGPE